MALKAGRVGVSPDYVDKQGKPVTTIPIATSTTVGGVKPAAKTSGMTKDVGIDSAGKLYTSPDDAELPAYTSGDAEKVLAVNEDGTGLEWIEQSAGGVGVNKSMFQSISGRGIDSYGSVASGGALYYAPLTGVSGDVVVFGYTNNLSGYSMYVSLLNSLDVGATTKGFTSFTSGTGVNKITATGAYSYIAFGRIDQDVGTLITKFSAIKLE